MTKSMTKPLFTGTLSRLFAGAIAIGAIAVSASVADAHDYTAGTLKIDHPWTRVTPPGAKVAGGFLKITNTGTEADRLLGGSFALSDRVEVHEMKVEDGVMRMKEVSGGLEIPPGGTVELKPGSYHVMFMGLKSSPKEGERVEGTLTFEKAGAVEVAYAVEPLGAKSSGTGAKDMHGEGGGHMDHGAEKDHGSHDMKEHGGHANH